MNIHAFNRRRGRGQTRRRRQVAPTAGTHVQRRVRDVPSDDGFAVGVVAQTMPFVDPHRRGALDERGHRDRR